MQSVPMNGKLGIFEMMVADDKKSATVRMRGIVAPRYWEGQQNTIAAVDVVKALEDLPDSVETLRVIVNSRGGSVSEGVEIYEALNDFKGKVSVEVHGMAASIASLILCAGEERKISKQGQVMIHQPTVYAGGNAKDLKAAVQSLENITEQMLDAYEENTTLSRDELREAMEATTFYKAADAVKFGFCTGLLERGGEGEEDFDGAGESNLIELKPEQLQHLEKHGWQEAAFAEIFELNKGPGDGSATKEDDMKLDFKLMGTLKGIFGAEKALELAEANQEATCLADFDEALKAHCEAQAKAVEEATAKLKEAEEAKATFEAENAALKKQVTDLGKAPVVVDMTGDPSEPENKGGKNDGQVLTGEALAKDQWEKNVSGIIEEFGDDESAFLAWAKSEDYPAEL